MPFHAQHPVRFAHCDPAGIVFYPRYFELIDAVMEDWTAATLRTPRDVMHRRLGLGMPTVRLETAFEAMSRLGERLDFSLVVERVGRASLDLAVEAHCGGERRLSARLVQVLVRLATSRAVAWPAPWRALLEEDAHEPA